MNDEPEMCLFLLLPAYLSCGSHGDVERRARARSKDRAFELSPKKDTGYEADTRVPRQRKVVRARLELRPFKKASSSRRLTLLYNSTYYYSQYVIQYSSLIHFINLYIKYANDYFLRIR